MDNLEKAKKLLGAAGTVGAGPILKAIGKFLPGIAHFSGGAAAAGYGADQVLDFLKDKLENPSSRRNREQLQDRAGQGVARSDELANLSGMEQRQGLPNALMGLGKLGAQAAGGISAAGAASDQQAQEQAMQQQQMQQQQASQEQNTQRQAQQDQLAAMKQQSKDLLNKESMDLRKQSNQRAQEKHEQGMKKKSAQTAGKKTVNMTYEEALRAAEQMFNRGP